MTSGDRPKGMEMTLEGHHEASLLLPTCDIYILEYYHQKSYILNDWKRTIFLTYGLCLSIKGLLDVEFWQDMVYDNDR